MCRGPGGMMRDLYPQLLLGRRGRFTASSRLLRKRRVWNRGGGWGADRAGGRVWEGRGGGDGFEGLGPDGGQGPAGRASRVWAELSSGAQRSSSEAGGPWSPQDRLAVVWRRLTQLAAPIPASSPEGHMREHVSGLVI